MTGNEGGLVLQDRDRRLLRELDTMRIIDREQSKLVAGFGSTTRANARLLALTRAGFLHRFFVGSIGAGRKAIYTLSPKAVLLVGAQRGGLQRRRGTLLVGDLYIEHQGRVNQVFVAVKHQSIPVTGTRFLRWLSFHKPVSQSVPLVPDGYFELETPPGVRAMFLEVDLGNETLRVWEQKTRSFVALAVSGDFLRSFGQPQFRVLVVTNSARRLVNIRRVVARQTDKIFWFTTFELISCQGGFWAPVWLRPAGDQPQALV